MRLIYESPQVAARDCQHCLQYEYDEKTGTVVVDDETGGPLARGDAFPAPCRAHAAGKRKDPCPKGTPEAPHTLTRQNQLAYDFYLECRAVGAFPDDPIVRRWAAIIDGIERQQRAKLGLMADNNGG